jgi:hypothetical protein
MPATTDSPTNISNVRLQWTNAGRMPADIVAKLEGAKVMIDEQATGRRQSYRNRIGAIRGIRFVDGELRANLILNPSHETTGQVAWDAANNPATLALKIRSGPGGTFFVALVAVTEGDSGGGLFESADGADATSYAPARRIPAPQHKPDHAIDLAAVARHQEMLSPSRRAEALRDFRLRMRKY